MDGEDSRKGRRRRSQAAHLTKAEFGDLQTLLDLAPVGIAIADDESCSVIAVNRHGANLMKIPPRTAPADAPNAGYRFEIDGRKLGAEELPLQKAWRTRRPVRDFQATYFAQDGSRFEYRMSAVPLLDTRGNVRRVVGVFDDISPILSAQRALERRSRQQEVVTRLGNRSLQGEALQALLDDIPDMLRPLLGVDYAKVLRFRPETNDFLLLSQSGFPEGTSPVVPGGADSQAGYTVTTHEPVIVKDLATEARFSGPALLRECGVVSGASVIIGTPDRPWGVLGVHARQKTQFTADEISFLQSIANLIAATVARDEAQAHQSFLLDELRHRVKNNFATVQAVASLSFRSGEGGEVSVDRFVSRLRSMAAAHDLHFKADWKDVRLGELIGAQTRPYDVEETRVSLSGDPSVDIPPRLAFDLAMVVHELATNAAKYGALSVPEGCVSVAWRRERSQTGPQVRVSWQERGGPAPRRDIDPGTGSRILEAVARRPEFSIRRDFGPAGLDAEIRLTLEN